MNDERLTANIIGCETLLADLVRVGGFSRFSYILDSYAFTKWRNRYQLEKALKFLIELGCVETSFKGNNRYGYMRYAATEKGKAGVERKNKAEEEMKKWLS